MRIITKKGYKMTSTGKWVVHTSAGIVIAGLFVFGCVQCNNREKAEKANYDKDNFYKSAVADNRDYGLMIDSLQNENSRKALEIARQSDTIHFQDAQIRQLRDSVRVLNKKLAKCRKGNKPKAQPAKKQPAVKKDTCDCNPVVKDTVANYRAPNGYIKITRTYRSR